MINFAATTMLEAEMRDRLAAKDAEIERLRAVLADEWQSIKTAPKDGRWIMVWQASIASVYNSWDTDHVYTPRFVSWKDDRWRDVDGDQVKSVTHWMSLPKPPRPLGANVFVDCYAEGNTWHCRSTESTEDERDA